MIVVHQRLKLSETTHPLRGGAPARYLDDVEKVGFGEWTRSLVRVRCGSAARRITGPRCGSRPAERRPELLRLGPEAVLDAILDQVVDEYTPVVAGLENDIDEIEDRSSMMILSLRRIYDLSREVIEFQRACHLLRDMLRDLRRGFDKYDVDVERKTTRATSSTRPAACG